MRTNDGDRFRARFATEELMSDADGERGERDARESHDAEPPVRASKAPKSRVKKPASRSLAPRPVAHEAAAPPKKAAPPAKRAKGKSLAPKPRRAPASKQVAADHAPAPISMDPRTTLRDHPGQRSAANSARAATATRRDDEISIPPTSSDPPTDLDDRFFAEGEEAAHAHAQLGIDAGRAARHAHPDDLELRRPAVVIPPERRKKLTNYVKVAVGFSAVLCLAALVRVGISQLGHPGGAIASTERSAAAAQIAAITPPPANPIPTTAAPVPPAVEQPVAVAEELAPPTAPPAKSAKQEKETSRAALEHGKRKDAIEAGERSVALDPTDAEAWLILGSAQQDSGHWKDARESFVQCTKLAKTGPVAECGMMLR